MPYSFPLVHYLAYFMKISGKEGSCIIELLPVETFHTQFLQNPVGAKIHYEKNIKKKLNLVKKT